MPSRTVSTFAMYSSGVWSLVIGPLCRGTGGGDRFAIARQAARARALALELVLVALHLLLLAVHEPDVVAKKQVQVLVAGARQLLLDGLELEQQVVAEGAHQPQPRIFLAAEFLDQAPAESKTPRAACCAPLRGTGRAAASAARPESRLQSRTRPSADDRPAGRGTCARSAPPRALSGRISTRRSYEMISSGGHVDAMSQREYLPGYSYPDDR